MTLASNGCPPGSDTLVSRLKPFCMALMAFPFKFLANLPTASVALSQNMLLITVCWSLLMVTLLLSRGNRSHCLPSQHHLKTHGWEMPLYFARRLAHYRSQIVDANIMFSSWRFVECPQFYTPCCICSGKLDTSISFSWYPPIHVTRLHQQHCKPNHFLR